ncbi:MAG: MmcQ/YjbR family DNA-binding protein [Gammaproteobacteria bacterium]
MGKPRVNSSTQFKPSLVAQRRARVAKLVGALPEASAVAVAGNHLSLEVRGRRFGWYLEDHHGDGRLALNCKVPAGENEALAARAPSRYHFPKYLGHHGWVGLWLDLPHIDWPEVERLLETTYRLAAPKSLLAKL